MAHTVKTIKEANFGKCQLNFRSMENVMQVPSYAFVARALGLPEGALDAKGKGAVKISREAMRLLLRFVALAAEFDERAYLKYNPDVAAAFEDGRIDDLRHHYIETGYFEGRVANEVHVDDEWYLHTYPDVANAVHEGVIPSALSHFKLRGEIELRSPDAQSLRWMQAWADVLTRSPSSVT